MYSGFNNNNNTTVEPKLRGSSIQEITVSNVLVYCSGL